MKTKIAGTVARLMRNKAALATSGYDPLRPLNREQRRDAERRARRDAKTRKGTA